MSEDKNTAYREVVEELKAIREARQAGNKTADELRGALDTLQAKVDLLAETLPSDPIKLKEDAKWRKVLDEIAEAQVRAAFEANKNRIDLVGRNRIDSTGFTFTQRMALGESELKRYYGPERVADIRSLQELADEALIVGTIMHQKAKRLGMTNDPQPAAFIKATRAYKQLQAAMRAMDTATAAEGLEWVPTDFSGQLLDVVAISLKLAATFPSIVMPTSPFKLPVATSDDVGFKAPESLTDSFLTEANKISALTPGTTNVTFTAQKAGALAVFSEEVDEESIIAIVPFLRTKIGNSIGNAIERAILDGDTAGTHQDNDVTASTDARKLWNGVRKDVGPAANGVDLATFNLANLRSLRKKLTAEFAEDAEQLVYAVSVDTALKLLEFSEFITVDKFGPNATILRGQVGRIDNTPVLTSKYARTDVASTGVNTAAGPNTKAVAYLYNRNAYMVGLRRGITIKTGEAIWTDQGIMVATWRGDFQKLRSGKTVAAVGKNLTTG